MQFVGKWLERRRLAAATPYLAGPLLDVGCGTCVAFAAAPDGYAGIDLDRGFLLERRSTEIPVLQGSAQELPFRPGSFQTVLLMAAIEHLPDPAACLREAVRVLAPGGCVVVTTPTPKGDRLHHALAKAGITSKHAADEHQSIFAGETLTAAFEEAGLNVEVYRPFLLGGNQVCVGRRPVPASASLAA